MFCLSNNVIYIFFFWIYFFIFSISILRILLAYEVPELYTQPIFELII